MHIFEYNSKRSLTRDGQLVHPTRRENAKSRPAFTTNPLLAQQQTISNQAVQRVLSSRLIQPKLTVSKPGDLYEEEADRVTERVVHVSESQSIQEMDVAGLSHPPFMKLQGGTRIQTTAFTVPAVVHEVLHSPGRPLDSPTHARMKQVFGRDFSHVRVHADIKASESAQKVDALAYTIGRDVVFGVGQYAPETTTGRGLLVHELTHVIQQGFGHPGESTGSGSAELHIGPSAGMLEAKAQRIAEAPTQEEAPIGRAHELVLQRQEQTGGRSGYTDAVRGSQPGGRVALVELQTMEVRGVACACSPATERDYDAETFRFITSIQPLIASTAGRRGVPTAAVAGAIADEYDTRRGLTGIKDAVQDAIIDALPECAIDVDRFFDIHAKLFNTLENDIGPANIKVRTALELVQRGELTVPGSPPSDIKVNRIVDFLFTERGTVEATTAVIARAERLFSPYLTEHGGELSEAVLVEYFKQGENYFDRFSRAIAVNPNHKVCPGDDGCQFWHNRNRILSSLRPPAPSFGRRPTPQVAGLVQAAVGPGPTATPLLGEWLGLHNAEHLSSDLTWILAQWPAGANINSLDATFQADVQALLAFVAITPGAVFNITSFARTPAKQHVMHVAQYIRNNWTAYNNFRYSLWPDVTAAGGTNALATMQLVQRTQRLNNIQNPDVLALVWDNGTLERSRQAAMQIATAYAIGPTIPVANGGAVYSWPTGNTTLSLHGTGRAVDASPVQLPNQAEIFMNQAQVWPALQTLQGEFGAPNIAQIPATNGQPAGYRINGLANVARRDAFLDLFFKVRSAARAGFIDLVHFQAP